MIPVSMVVYWMMIFDDWKKQSDTCVNGGLLNDDILIFWLKQKQSDTGLNDDILKNKVQWWFIEWWYFD